MVRLCAVVFYFTETRSPTSCLLDSPTIAHITQRRPFSHTVATRRMNRTNRTVHSILFFDHSISLTILGRLWIGETTVSTIQLYSWWNEITLHKIKVLDPDAAVAIAVSEYVVDFDVMLTCHRDHFHLSTFSSCFTKWRLGQGVEWVRTPVSTNS